MGTNYYLEEKPPCACCGRSYPAMHIGKSSAGWAFSLHVYDEDGPRNLAEWIDLWTKSAIQDEYGTKVSAAEMEAIVTKREWNGSAANLLRHNFHNCIGQIGTYDLILGDFT